jgi:PAS domain S-box-containing protein
MPIPLKVLIAEDNPLDAELLVRELRRAGFEPEWQRVETELAFLEKLDGGLDLVMSDYHMPFFTGFRALELLQKSGLDIPFILVSGTIGEESAVDAMRKGATDYLLKDRLGRLGTSITHAMTEVRLRRDRQKEVETHRITHAQLSQLLEHSPAVLYVLKVVSGKIVPFLISESVFTMLGFTVAEASSQEWWLTQLHPDDRERTLNRVNETFRTGATLTEYRMRRKDGSYSWIEDNQRAIRDADGKPIEIIGVWTDVTERKRAEGIIRQASGDATRGRRRKMYLEIGILATSAVGIYALAYFTSWFEFITRWVLARKVENIDEIILTTLFVAAGFAIFAFRRWRERELEMTSHQQVEASLGLLHDELDRRVQLRTRELNNANDALRAEIAERRKTIDALGESEAQFRQVVENIHEVFWIADPSKGGVLYVSPTYEKIWGRSCQSAYSGPDIGLSAVHPDDRARILQAEQTKQVAGTYDEEYRIVRPDGSNRWIHECAFPVRNAAGELYRIVGVAEDITERKQLEEQFRQAQKMEAIGTLAGGIAHDFNNILSAIIGYTELADMTMAGNPKVHGYLGGVLQAARRATDLIRQILTFSRQQEQERHPIKILPVVEESLTLLRATIPSTIEFETSLASDAPTILADATQIHQILMNLGTNAWYAMRSVTGRLCVKLEKWVVDEEQVVVQPRLRLGVYARISIRDTGCGMDQATLRRVFEPFFTTKPLGEGTGLGLAVVHGIMDSHDGVITVSSRPGEGTTFCLYFPAYAGEAVVAPAADGPLPPGGGERILVVDDEEVLALLLQRALTALGYKAEFATQPEEALALVRADPQRFALVLTDQTMPTMTGLLLASNLLEIRPGLPVIMMTGYTAPRMSERVAAAGIRGLLLKPITMQALGAAVHAALTNKRPLKSIPKPRKNNPVMLPPAVALPLPHSGA